MVNHKAQFKTSLRDAEKLKKVMIKKGLTKAQAQCPECEGMLQGVLYKGRTTREDGWCISMRCNGSCRRAMME